MENGTVYLIISKLGFELKGFWSIFPGIYDKRDAYIFTMLTVLLQVGVSQNLKTKLYFCMKSNDAQILASCIMPTVSAHSDEGMMKLTAPSSYVRVATDSFLGFKCIKVSHKFSSRLFDFCQEPLFKQNKTKTSN